MHGNFAVFSLQMCVTGVQNFLNKTEEKSKNKRCDYEVPGMVLLHAHLYTHSLLRGDTFEVLPLSSCALCPVMLPLLGTSLILLLWNSFQCLRHISLDAYSILKS